MAITYHFNRGGTIGVGYLGVVLTSVVYGITCIQSFQYYRSPRAKTDAAIIKYLVLCLWILDTLQEVLAVHAFYFFLVSNYENPLALLVSIWSLPSGIMVNACISCLVKIFFMIRIWRLSGNVHLTVVGAVVNVVRFVMNLYYPIRSFCDLSADLVTMEVRLKPFGVSGLALEVTCDLMISISMTYYLQRGRRNSLRRSGDMLSRLILLTVATGTLSTLIGTADLIAYLASPDTFYPLFFNFLIAKLDANALLTSLNSRQFIRDGSGPNVVCINNDPNPKTISCALSSPSDSSVECGPGGGERAGSGHDAGREIVCKVVVDETYVM
ncbi:hypothetical protein GSI_14374 [Ganoderma sinense ZZ0214-1]|uniref:DUF6534 domain-containing protein n=1 Tax=Ganoderma sinense ZZ0214-1 TaxID=1077348 RepID=A0A2G8RNI3_9APHY|nr:hypothetical protein GSI_14374 [Ganoderma sinense ZZ0214-1]